MDRPPKSSAPSIVTPAGAGSAGPGRAGTPSIKRNTVLALLVQATTSAFTAITTLIVVRLLTPEGFGAFSLAFGIATLASLVARFGIQQSVARFIAENRSDTVACAAFVRDALRLVVVTAMLTSSALFVAAPALASAFGDSAIVWPLRGMAVALFAETVFGLYLTTFNALALLAVNLRLVFLESVAEMAGTLTLVFAGTGAAGAAFGRAIGYGVGAAIAVVVAVRLLGKVSAAIWTRSDHDRQTRKILRYAFPLFVLDALYGLYMRVDVLFIGAILGTAAVGLYSAPSRLMTPLGSVGQAVANSVAPRQATSTNEAPRVDAFIAAVRLLVLFHAVLIAPLVVWAVPIINLILGSAYGESADVLRWLAPAVLLSGVTPLVSTTVNFLGRAARRIPIALAALGVNVAINLALLPVIGIVASAIAASAALVVYVPAHLRVCARELGFPLRGLLLSFLRAAAAAFSMGVVLYLIGGTESLSVVTAFLGTVFGLVAFFGTLLLSREVTTGELRSWAKPLGNAVGALRR